MNPYVLILTAAAMASTGCIYTDVRTPLAYRAPTPADVGGQLGAEVTGKACNHAILWMVAFGDASYQAALEQAKAQVQNAPLLADVRADVAYDNYVFGVYQRQCTVITARAARVASVAQP